jgi:hypothetical protein
LKTILEAATANEVAPTLAEQLHCYVLANTSFAVLVAALARTAEDFSIYTDGT